MDSYDKHHQIKEKHIVCCSPFGELEGWHKVGTLFWHVAIDDKNIDGDLVATTIIRRQGKLQDPWFFGREVLGEL